MALRKQIIKGCYDWGWKPSSLPPDRCQALYRSLAMYVCRFPLSYARDVLNFDS